MTQENQEQNKEEVPQKKSTPVVTEEIAAQYEKGGGIPKAIRKQVVAINRRKRREKFKETQKGIVQSGKSNMEHFLEEFIKNGGNATQAALAVFNCSTIQSASALGHAYLKKAKGLGLIYLEKRGYGYGRMLDVAIKKMEESKTPDWWDRLMKVAGYEDFMTKGGGTSNVVNVIQAHKQYASDYIEGEAVAENEEMIGEVEDDEPIPVPVVKEAMPKGKLKEL